LPSRFHLAGGDAVRDDSPICLEERDGAVYLKVRAAPGASRDRVAGLHGGRLKVAVSAPPERGKANAALAGVIARALGLRAAQVVLAAGATSRDKVFRLEGLSVSQARERRAPLAAARGRQA
jgi:uncharacterized protein (TIGR00251 family)